MKNNKCSHWGQLITQLREEKVWTEEKLAEMLETDQATISRWECGLAEPRSRTVRQKLERLAREAKLGPLGEAVEMVKSSPFPMILVDQQGIVVAASASSGFLEGRTCFEHSPLGEQATLSAFDAKMNASGFWQMQIRRMDYEFTGDDGVVRRAIVTRLTFWGEAYALVQKAW
ncbi:MAG: helix-turn-helix transcriptional regulator [Candidatus Methylumidiphilus sp.]